MIYLDYAATTPMSESALHVFSEVSRQYFGNSSSLHDIGSDAKTMLEESRKQLATYFNGNPEGVYFTSGGSEGNHLALISMARANASKGRHLITTTPEHASVSNTFQLLEEEGFKVTKLPVNSVGKIEIEVLDEALEEETILVSICHANGEVGALQPLEEIGRLLKNRGILFHSDCVQTFGKVPIDVKKIGLDSFTVSSHKVYGPKGVGACYIAPEVMWKAAISGTTHEKGFRPGTVNVPGNAAFVTAAGEMVEQMDSNEEHYWRLRNTFLDLIKSEEKIVVEGTEKDTLPSIIGCRVKGMEGQYLMLELNRKGFAVSTGSACSAGQQAPSKTMLAIGRTPDEAREFVRISFGIMTTVQEVEALVWAIEEILLSKTV